MKLSIVGVFLASALFAQQTITFNAPAPPAVSGVSAQASSTGFGNYCWWVVASYAIGKSPVSQPACLSNVGGTVTVRWTPITGATYDVLRTNSSSLPSGAASIAVATGVVGASQVDSFGALSSYTIASAAPAVATIQLDNLNHASPGIYQSINNGPYSPIGSGGGGAVTMATGTGDPNAGAVTCTAPSNTNLALYQDTSTGNLWACTATNTWVLMLTTQGSGPYSLSAAVGAVSTGLAAARPACSSNALYFATDTNVLSQCNAVTATWTTLNPAGYVALIFDSAKGTLNTYDNAGNIFGPVKGIPNPADSNCVAYIDQNGIQQRVSCGGGTGGNTTLFHLGTQTETSLTTNTDNVLGSYTLPSLGAGQCVMLKTYFKHSTGSASITYRWWFGATNNGASASTAGTTVYRDNWYICNRAGVQNAQDMYMDAGDGTAIGTNSFQVLNPTENTAAGVVIKFTANPGATAANGVTLYGFTVNQ